MSETCVCSCVRACFESGSLYYVALAILEPTELRLPLPPVVDCRCGHHSAIYRKLFLTFQAQVKLLTHAKRMEECFSIPTNTVPILED